MTWAAIGTVVLLAALKVAHDTRAHARAIRAERLSFEEYVARWQEGQARLALAPNGQGVKAFPVTTDAPSLATADGASGELFDERQNTD